MVNAISMSLQFTTEPNCANSHLGCGMRWILGPYPSMTLETDPYLRTGKLCISVFALASATELAHPRPTEEEFVQVGARVVPRQFD